MSFVVDGREGMAGRDREIANELRRTANKVLLAVNKTEGMSRQTVIADFWSLGLGQPYAISAAHGDGVPDLIEEALPALPEASDPELSDDTAQSLQQADDAPPTPEAIEAAALEGHPPAPVVPVRPRRIRVAVVGRPNAGKSTLINTLLGEERMIAFDQPGTTRDAVAVDFERGGRPYTLIDTAGVRRRGKVTDVIEKFSVVKTLQAIEDSHVCVLLLDASEDVADAHRRERIRVEFDRKLGFLSFARMHVLTATEGKGVSALMRSVDEAFAAATAKLSTPRLTRALLEAVERQQPPRRGPIRPKMRYAHQGGQNPPIVVIHGNALDRVPDSYRRYLEGWFRDRFALQGTPLRVEFKTSRNPYAAPR